MRPQPDSATPDLFEIPEAPAATGGSLDYATELCHTLSEMIDDAIKRGVISSRYTLAGRMSELLGQDITKAQIDAWTAESKERWRFPFEFAAAFEAACDSHRLQQLLARKRGSRILVGREALHAELGKIREARLELAAREKSLEKQIRGKR